jgi:hypothetical protein
LEATQLTVEILTVELEATAQVPAKDQTAVIKHNLALYNKENQSSIKLRQDKTRQDAMGRIFCPSLFYFFSCDNLSFYLSTYLTIILLQYIQSVVK